MGDPYMDDLNDAPNPPPILSIIGLVLIVVFFLL